MAELSSLIKCESVFEGSGESFAETLSFSQCIEKKLLVSPDSKRQLRVDRKTGSLTDGNFDYELKIRQSKPISGRSH